MTTTLTLLDACAVINFFATTNMDQILASIPGPVAVVDIVAAEPLFVRRGDSGDDADEREPVDLAPLVSGGLLTVIDSDDEAELLTYLDFALEVDSGEAMTAALALHRNATVVTDDRKALRLLMNHGIPAQSTLAILKACCEQIAAPEQIARTMLWNLRVRARYVPGRNHEHRTWWEAMLDD